jgi:hypothetical protein
VQASVALESKDRIKEGKCRLMSLLRQAMMRRVGKDVDVLEVCRGDGNSHCTKMDDKEC